MTALLGIAGVGVLLWVAVLIFWIRSLRDYLSRAA